MTDDAVGTRLLDLGGEEYLRYTVRRTQRRKTVGIFVGPDGSLSVLAPQPAPDHRVQQILRGRLKWIRRQQQEVRSLPLHPPAREWVAGETHRYLGRQYRLRLIEDDGCSVRLIGQFFEVSVPDRSNRAHIRQLMAAWYRSHARVLIESRVQEVALSTSWLNVEPPPIRIGGLRDRWGSTSRAGRVSFNSDLIKLPLSCVDYVVAHELVHLKIPNHSPAFWRMLGRVMPDWRRRRQSLMSYEL